MALTDVVFNEGDGRDFILERAVGALNEPDDILIEAGSAAYPVQELPEIVGGGGGNIFIIPE